MTTARVPTEVELAFELMPCNALRVALTPGPAPHPCSYFRKWGRYHSYDYEVPGAPAGPGIVQPTEYVGKAALVPEMLSGCRKAPILAVGINPNLPGWWKPTRRSLNPLFDDVRQYAHYFRYRETAKLELSDAEYQAFGGGPADTPFANVELNVPPDATGHRTVHPQLAEQKMYQAYQSLLDALAAAQGWANHKLVVGEDLAYANMVACPSAKWTTQPDPNDPSLPPMSDAERTGIVGECFRSRKYFLRQLFQSLPSILLVFSQNTANAFIGEVQGRFSKGNPAVGEPVTDLLNREILLKYGDLPNGDVLDARVIFAPHPTGNPAAWDLAKPKVIAQLVQAVQSGRVTLNAQTKHLARTRGSCVFCTMLEIGPCDYEAEIEPLAVPPVLAGAMALPLVAIDKPMQHDLLAAFQKTAAASAEGWKRSDEPAAP